MATSELPPTGAASIVAGWRPRFPTATATLLGIVLASAVARGATVDKPPGPIIRYTAAAGEINHISLSKVGTSIVISDGNPNPVTATTAALSFGCLQVAGSQVSCPVSGIAFVEVSAGDMNDEVRNTLPDASLTLTLDGGTGDDFLDGGPANDFLYGGNGCDTFDGRDGYDNIQGGSNGMGCFDTVTYENAGAGVTVIIGGAGGTDMVNGEVEKIIGSPFNDSIQGDNDTYGDGIDDRDFIYGGLGNDVIYSLGGDDQVTADASFEVGDGTADDFIDCGAGTDVSWGEPGDGLLHGPSEQFKDCETKNVRGSTTSTTAPTTSTSTSSTSTTSMSSTSTSRTSTSTSTSSTTTTTLGNVVYIDDNGNDGLNGTSETVGGNGPGSGPVKTWGRAFDLVSSNSTTVVALDGTYTTANNGRFDYDCGGTSLCDTPNASTNVRWCGSDDDTQVAIKAKNERQAWIKAGGNGPGIHLDRCRFVTVQGFRVTSKSLGAANGGTQDDNVHVENCEDVTVRRNLITTNNNAFNDHLLRYENGLRPVVEENEFYDYHRHAMNITDSIGGRVTGNYCNGRGRTCHLASCGCCGNAQGCCDDNQTGGGDECVGVYASNGTIVENNVSEEYGGGFQMHGGHTFTAPAPPYDGTDYGGSDVQMHGNIAIDSNISFYMDARTAVPGGSNVDPPGAVRNNVLSNNVAVDQGTGPASSEAMYAMRAATNVRLENCVAVGGGTAQGGGFVDGFKLKDDNTNECAFLSSQQDASGDFDTCSARLKNTIGFDNAGQDYEQVDLTSGDYNPCTAMNVAADNLTSEFAGLFGDGTTGGPTGCGDTGSIDYAAVAGYGDEAGESVIFVPHGGNILDGNGEATATNKVCHGGTSPYLPCTTDGVCTGAGPGSCSNDVGANILCRTFEATRTSNRQCTGNKAPWPCCTGPNTGDCDVWARDNDAICNSTGCLAASADCDATHTYASGTASMPSCEYHFFGCGAIVTGCNGDEAQGCNNINGNSCFDFQERLGVNFGNGGTTVTPPACP